MSGASGIQIVLGQGVWHPLPLRFCEHGGIPRIYHVVVSPAANSAANRFSLRKHGQVFLQHVHYWLILIDLQVNFINTAQCKFINSDSTILDLLHIDRQIFQR